MMGPLTIIIPPVSYTHLDVYKRQGIVSPSRLSAAKDVKFRIFHGDADDVVPVKGSREAYKALKAAGADVEYIEFPGCNHGSWNPAFNYPGFMDWLFKQKKKR